MNKGPDAFRTISEVAEDLDVPQHVLRFWETRFPPIRPLKRGGGRRYYRPDDVDLLKGIRLLLYGQGYTIKGVQRILKEDGQRFVQEIGRGEQAPGPMRPHAPEEGPDDGSAEAAGGFGTWEETHTVEAARPPGPMRAADSSAGGPYGTSRAADVIASGPFLDLHDRERLRKTLDELLECQRILESLKAG